MGKCLICRQDGEPLLNSTADTDYEKYSELNEIHKSWSTTCVRSLCTLIKVPELQYLFLNANYCETCLQLIRDIDLSLQQINNFQKQILGFRDHIFIKFGQNYEVAVVANAAVGTTKQLAFDEKVKFVYGKINEGSNCWTGRDFMHRNPLKNHQRNVLEVLKIEFNDDDNKAMEFHEEETAEEFILPISPQDVYKEKAIKDEPEQDLDSKDPDWRCSGVEEVVLGLVFGPQNVLDDLNTDNEPMEFPTDEKNTKDRSIAAVIKEEPSGEDQGQSIMDLNEDRDPDWESSDAESFEDNFTLRPSKKRFSIKGDSEPYQCELCSENFKLNEHLLAHMRRVHSLKCHFCGLEFKTQEEQDEHENIHKNSDQPFKCTITNCDQVFPNSTALKQHMFVHFDNRHKCDVCGKRFHSVRGLMKHQKIHDDSFVGFQCTVCNKICNNPNALASHMNTHSDEKKHVCDICSATFKTKATLSTHRRIHSEATFICRICGKGFRTAHNLKDHEETHSGTRSYECKICGRKFGVQHHLKSHEKTHDPNKKEKIRKQKCEVCNKMFSNLKDHKKTHRITAEVSCLECDKVFKYEESLQMHMARYHLMKCKFCAMDCETKVQLDEHENVHKNKDQPFTCTICDEVFSNSARLKQHMFTHTEKDRPSCDICGKSFQTARSLKRHGLMHDDSFVGFPCTVCNYKCLTALVLELHMEIHSDEKKYTCDVCSAAFKQVVGLRRHKRKHDAGLKFICQICGKGFTSLALLRSHEEIHSGTLSYECKTCCKKFKARRNLRQHEKIHEPIDPNKKKRNRYPPNPTSFTTKSRSQPKKVKRNRSSLKYQDSSSSDCESEEGSDYSVEDCAKTSNQDHVQEQQVQTVQYPSSSSTQQQVESEYYNMPHSSFQYPS